LVEGYVDRVEQRRDLRQRTAVERQALPEPRSVEVQRDAAIARPGALIAELLPAGELSADLALRQLEQQRCDRLHQRVEIGARDQARAWPHEASLERMQAAVASLFVQLQVAGG